MNQLTTLSFKERLAKTQKISQACYRSRLMLRLANFSLTRLIEELRKDIKHFNRKNVPIEVLFKKAQVIQRLFSEDALYTCFKDTSQVYELCPPDSFYSREEFVKHVVKEITKWHSALVQYQKMFQPITN